MFCWEAVVCGQESNFSFPPPILSQLDVFGLKGHPEGQVLSSFVNSYPDLLRIWFPFPVAFLPSVSSYALSPGLPYPAGLSLLSTQPYSLGKDGCLFPLPAGRRSEPPLPQLLAGTVINSLSPSSFTWCWNGMMKAIVGPPMTRKGFTYAGMSQRQRHVSGR